MPYITLHLDLSYLSHKEEVVDTIAQNRQTDRGNISKSLTADT